jgi:Rps23 Pro-64 3,4-dihydroxylase Tpa1-like proline 4-hydroxylase
MNFPLFSVRKPFKNPALRLIWASFNTEKPMQPRIFVQIASYRDPDCQWTVKDMFEKAAHPERVFAGICWQFVKGEDDFCFKEPYPRPKQVRVHEMDARKAKGVCYARSLTQKLWQDEEFTLQIDSHMRFEQGWDDLLIDMWKACGSEKSILTCYPPGFTPPDQLQKDWIFGMAAKHFDQHGILLMHGKPGFQTKNPLPNKPIPGVFASACMFFGPSSIIKDVPYDPNLYFFGEEISLAVRFWTHGYDIYHPNRLVIYHDWDRTKRKTHFDDHKEWPVQNEKSFARVRHMLGTEISRDKEVIKDLKTYGLGNVRTLSEYEAYSGVSFSTRSITPQALRGEYGWMNTSTASDNKTSGRHQPRKVFESKEAIIFDDFLPEDVFQRVSAYALKANYETINAGKITRAWHVQDGNPLRSQMNLFYYAPGVEKPQGNYVYPTKTDLDLMVDHLLTIQPQVEHLIGKQSEGWAHVSATAWLYPPGTGLALHDDGSGVYSGAYVFFLNHHWRMHWGGLLIMMDEECNRRVHEFRNTHDQMEFYNLKWLNANGIDDLLMEHGFGKCILPKRNRMVFIANDAYHTVTRVNEQAGDNVRMSIAGFFNRPKAKAKGNDGNY